jgi:hypothetical protein
MRKKLTTMQKNTEMIKLISAQLKPLGDKVAFIEEIDNVETYYFTATAREEKIEKVLAVIKNILAAKFPKAKAELQSKAFPSMSYLVITLEK